MRALLVLLVGLCAPLIGLAQPEPENLSAAIDRGEAEIILVQGRGSSTGNALEAVLTNPSGEARMFSVWLRRPLFFENKGSGQNMIATRVHLDEGTFYRYEDTDYIYVQEGQLAAAIDLWSYCVDFDKENPLPSDGFLELRTMPLAVWEMADRISEFEQLAVADGLNMDEDGRDFTMTVSQLALWLSQGIPANRILARLPYEPGHLEVARLLLEDD